MVPMCVCSSTSRGVSVHMGVLGRNVRGRCEKNKLWQTWNGEGKICTLCYKRNYELESTYSVR